MTGLVDWHPATNAIRPGIGESWETSPNGKRGHIQSQRRKMV